MTNLVVLRSLALGIFIGSAILLPLLVLDERRPSRPRRLVPTEQPAADTVTSSEVPAGVEQLPPPPSTSADEAGLAIRELEQGLADEPSTTEKVLAAVTAAWPEDTKRARKIALCESGAGYDPKAWEFSHPDGGPMQINRATWADYFLKRYGWTWEQIVFDLEIHMAAAREIYDLTGGWHRWACADRVLSSG